MEIKIDTKYRITSDERQYYLEEIKTVSDKKSANHGVEYMASQRSYRTLEQVLNAYVEISIRKSDATTLEQLRADINKVNDTVSSLIKELGYKIT